MNLSHPPLRGLMLDAARLVESPDHYRRFLDFCAAWGVNAAIFRLADDQGCALRFHSHPELVTRILGDLYVEAATLFRGRYLHAGCDETNWGGSAFSQDLLKTRSKAQVWGEYLNALNAIARGLGREMIIWDDMVLQHEPAILDHLDRDVILHDWEYAGTDPAPVAARLALAREKGFRMIGGPALHWCKWGPRAGASQLANLDAYADVFRSGGDNASLGVIATHWCPARYLRDSVWDGLAYARHNSHYDASVPPELFTLTGSPYRGNAQMTGRPLRPEELFHVLDLERPGLEAVKAAVTKGDRVVAAAALLAYYRALPRARMDDRAVVRSAPRAPGRRPRRRPRPALPTDARPGGDRSRHEDRPYRSSGRQQRTGLGRS